MNHNILGIDIGGANLKLVDLQGQVWTEAFPLWRQPELLTETLQRALSRFDSPALIALTMTGELCDCFENKAAGVAFITASCAAAAGDIPLVVWQTAGEFVPPEIAIEFPALTAAANWHALATWAARMTAPDQFGLLIDIGSTTVDLIPLARGHVSARGHSDFDRLRLGELVYTGGRRTPVMAVTGQVELQGETVPLAAEFFASMHDVYLLTGDFPEEPSNCDTADSRPADRLHARQRLARMLCADAADFMEAELNQLAAQLAALQQQTIRGALDQVLSAMETPPTEIVISGSSDFLAEHLIASHPQLTGIVPLALAQHLGAPISSAACAYAVAQLASERIRLT